MTWLTDPATIQDSRLWDIDPDGVAVGQVRADGVTKEGIISFPGRPLTYLDDLVGGQLPVGLELISGYILSDDLLVGGDLVAEDGTWYCYAAQLSDDGTTTSLDWFHIFQGPPGSTRMFLYDASENGDHFVLSVRYPGAGGEDINEIHRWSPRSVPQDSEVIATLDRTLNTLSVNNAGQVCWSVVGNYDRDTFIYDPALLFPLVAVDEEARFYSQGADIAEDGTVIGGYTTSRRGSLNAATWTGAAGWNTLPSTSGDGGRAWAVNNAHQMIVATFDVDRLFYYSEVDGFQRLDDLVISSGQPDDLARWFGNEFFNTGFHPLSATVDDIGYGYITGALYVGGGARQAFILTPVPVTAP